MRHRAVAIIDEAELAPRVPDSTIDVALIFNGMIKLPTSLADVRKLMLFGIPELLTLPVSQSAWQCFGAAGATWCCFRGGYAIIARFACPYFKCDYPPS